MQTGWLQEAANALEKSLLLAPDQAGVQLDFAQTLAELGQKTSARQLVATVAARPDIQPDLRQWLSTGLLPENNTWKWSGLLQNSAGHESNLSSATYTNSLTLYLPSGPVQVSLAENEKPRSGLGLKTTFTLQGLRPLNDGALRLSLSLQARHAQSVDESQLSEGAASYALTAGPSIINVQLGASQFKQTNQYSYSDTSWRIKIESKSEWLECKPATFAGQVNQRYQSNTNLSGQFKYAGLEIQCNQGQQAQTTLSLSAGTDHPDDPNRPGGAKNRHDLTLRHHHLLTLSTPTGTKIHGLIKAWLRQSHTQDQALFSPLLGQSNVKTRRQDIGMAYWWPIAPNWSMGIDLENTSQKSNNTLLNIRNLTLYASVKWTSKP
jgi:Tetratricopeptide repeat